MMARKELPEAGRNRREGAPADGDAAQDLPRQAAE